MIERFVVFGASGDLTSRLLMPAIAQLAEAALLPAGFSIMGSADTDWTPSDFREHIAERLAEHAADVSPEARDAVVGMLDYRTADVTNAADVVEVLGVDRPPSLAYLALPSVILESVIPALADAGLGAGDAVAVEKPFGTDLASARRINEVLRSRLPETTVFRIDHFLSNELVRRVLSMRFLNRVIEPVLDARHVSRVDISWLESLALEGRASYYDRAGALKDMIQNHLLEAMSLVAMEQPARVEDASVRGARVEAFRAIPTPDIEAIRSNTVRARYGAGVIGSRSVPAYVDEPGVDPSRSTETYAAVDLEVANARWGGVPFTLRSGKAMAADAAEIAIHFRAVPPYLDQRVADVEPNVLRIGLMEPYVRLGLTVNGPDRTAVAHDLKMTSGAQGRSAYANLVLEALRENPMLFVRDDEVEEAWRVIDPIAEAWAKDQVPLQEYVAGGPAPAVAV